MTIKPLPPPPADYIVVAEVAHGPYAAPLLAKYLFCSIECAGDGVHQLASSIAEYEKGSAFALRHRGRPVGFVVTRGGRLWVVRILASDELPTAG